MEGKVTTEVLYESLGLVFKTSFMEVQHKMTINLGYMNL